MRGLTIAPFAVLCAAVASAACDSERDLRGPLAQIADTVLNYGLECNEVDHWPLRRAQPPFEDCRGAVLDTAMIVVSDASDSAVVVTRRWAVGAGAEEKYSELLTVLQQQYGEGVFIQSPFGEHPDRLLTIWSFDTHHLRLRLMPSEGYMFLQWELGPPEY